MFNQRVAGALDRPHPAERAKDAAYERRFAGTKLAGRGHDHPAAKPGRKRSPRTRAGVGVGKIPAKRFYNGSSAAVFPSAMPAAPLPHEPDLARLARDLRAWARELGFAEIGLADTGLAAEEARLTAWLAAGRHGGSSYMARQGAQRARTAAVMP